MGGTRRRLVWLAALVVAVVLPGVLTAAARASSGHEVVLPAFHSNAPALPDQSLGSEAGVEWNGASAGGRYTTDGGRTVRTASIGYISAFIGNDLISAGEELDVTTGQITHLGLHQPDHWLAGLGGGAWLEFHPGSTDIDRYQTGQGLVASYPPPPVDGAPGASGWIVPVRMDSNGGFLYNEVAVGNPPTTRASMSYLDFASGTYTTVADTAGMWNGVADENADWLAWCRDNHTVAWAPRMAPSVQQSIPIKGCGGVALSGNNIAIRTLGTGPDGKSRAVIYSGSLLGQLTQLSTTMPVWAPMRTANGNFTVEAGSTAADAGVYRLPAGSANIGSRIVRWGPAVAAPGDIIATSNRLFTYYGGKVEMRSVRVSGGRASYGGATRIGSADIATADGSRTARIQVSRKNVRTVIVQDGAKVIGRYGVSSYSYKVTLSGHRLIVAHWSTWDPNSDPWGGASTLIDLSTGRQSTVPRTSALDNNRIAYLTHNGQVRVRDLRTGRERVVRHRGGSFDPSCTNPTDATVEVSGDWVLYVIPNCSGKVVDAAAVDLATGHRTSLTRAFANVFGLYAAVHLSGEFAAWVDHGPFAVHLMNLSTGHDHVVGHAWKPGAQCFSLTGHYLAWIASDTRRHLLAF